jgi:hypothetical protein
MLASPATNQDNEIKMVENPLAILCQPGSFIAIKVKNVMGFCACFLT